jgi:hypothetical protein
MNPKLKHWHGQRACDIVKKKVDIKCSSTPWFPIQMKEKRSAPHTGAIFDMSRENTFGKFLYETGYKL